MGLQPELSLIIPLQHLQRPSLDLPLLFNSFIELTLQLMYPKLSVIVHLHILILVVLLEFLHLILQAFFLVGQDVCL